MNIWVNRINAALAASIYILFFFVPLIVIPTTYELFEFNKMWFTFTIGVIVFFLWGARMILEKRFIFRRTPLDIFILIFLISQILSTFISLDFHLSLWGYYSRWNGGLLSIVTYIFLYYAIASNLLGYKTDEEAKKIKHWREKVKHFFSTPTLPFSYKLAAVSLLSGLLVVLWGIPSHFGYDPTCFAFRGELNVDCWTEAFQPTIRMFSTLGQPNWLATYVSILLLPLIAFFINSKMQASDSLETPKSKQNRLNPYAIRNLILGISIVLFYLSLIWTKSQSGFLGFWVGFIVMALLSIFVLLKRGSNSFSKLVKLPVFKFFAIIGIIFVGINIIFGFPIERLNKFTLQNIQSSKSASQPTGTNTALEELGGTSSSQIRLIVWRGALDVFKNNPILGSGVETFAFSYYKNRPVEHNMTSEWDYLYNKAHNEFLNYAATTGILGVGSYLLVIASFLFISIKQLLKIKNKGQINTTNVLLATAFIGSYVSILVSNFFGFSVVVVNLFFFLIPLFVFELLNIKKLGTLPKQQEIKSLHGVSIIGIVGIGIIALYLLLTLARFWVADTRYALGYNLNRLDQYFEATQELVAATKLRPSEPVFRDELAINLGTLALIAAQNGEATQAAELAKQAKMLSDDLIRNHPNNLNFYKSRTRILYGLSEVDPKYLDESIKSVEKAYTLAPTDPKLLYNRALLYQQVGDMDKTVADLENVIKLKKDYRDGYYALALILSEQARNATGSAQATELRTRARSLIEYSLKNIAPNDPDSEELLKSL